MSHHPPIHCIHAENDHFIYEGFFDIKLQFSFSGFSVKPLAYKQITMKRTGEVYKVISPSYSLHNIIIGKLYIWYFGKFEVIDLND